MKILVVQDWLRSGGTERQSVFLSNAFAAAGHATTLLTFRPGGRLSGSVSSAVTMTSLQPFDLRLDWFAPGLGRAAARHVPDAILCMGRMANCYGAVLQRRAPASATIATMRTGKPLPPLFRRSLGAVRHVVANSREARDSLVRRYAVPDDKISVIYNSIVFPSAPERDPIQRESLRGRFGASANTHVLLCVAMFRPEKNQRELIDVVAGLPPTTDFQLWLAGEGPARAECEALARSRRLNDRVKFVGFHGDPTPLYDAADIAVHASWSDALSNFVIEAQAHGLPAVVFDGQGMRECVVPERTGWVIERGNHDGFRARLLALMNELPATRSTRAAEARAYARTTFDPTRQVQAYLALFAKLKAAE